MKEVRNFKELMNIKSETHYIEYDDYNDSYWVMCKNKDCRICGRSGYYLSTHTFYESYSNIPQEVLNKLGFDVKIIGSWGGGGEIMILFLDIDGVLNGGRNGFNTVEEYARAKKEFKEEFGIHFLLPDINVLPFVECINKYIEQNGENSIKAVLSSTWRYGSKNIELLNNLLYKKGLKDIKFIIDKTDRINDCRTAKDRGNQINRWVRKNEPKGFVILDDEFSTMVHKGRLYKTNTFVGFRDEHIEGFLNHINKWRDNENKGN